MPIFLDFMRFVGFKCQMKVIVTYRKMVQFDRMLAQKMVQ